MNGRTIKRYCGHEYYVGHGTSHAEFTSNPCSECLIEEALKHQRCGPYCQRCRELRARMAEKKRKKDGSSQG